MRTSTRRIFATSARPMLTNGWVNDVDLNYHSVEVLHLALLCTLRVINERKLLVYVGNDLIIPCNDLLKWVGRYGR